MENQLLTLELKFHGSVAAAERIDQIFLEEGETIKIGQVTQNEHGVFCGEITITTFNARATELGNELIKDGFFD